MTHHSVPRADRQRTAPQAAAEALSCHLCTPVAEQWRLRPNVPWQLSSGDWAVTSGRRRLAGGVRSCPGVGASKRGTAAWGRGGESDLGGEQAPDVIQVLHGEARLDACHLRLQHRVPLRAATTAALHLKYHDPVLVKLLNKEPLPGLPAELPRLRPAWGCAAHPATRDGTPGRNAWQTDGANAGQCRERSDAVTGNRRAIWRRKRSGGSVLNSNSHHVIAALTARDV